MNVNNNIFIIYLYQSLEIRTIMGTDFSIFMWLYMKLFNMIYD